MALVYLSHDNRKLPCSRLHHGLKWLRELETPKQPYEPSDSSSLALLGATEGTLAGREMREGEGREKDGEEGGGKGLTMNPLRPSCSMQLNPLYPNYLPNGQLQMGGIPRIGARQLGRDGTLTFPMLLCPGPPRAELYQMALTRDCQVELGRYRNRGEVTVRWSLVESYCYKLPLLHLHRSIVDL